MSAYGIIYHSFLPCANDIDKVRGLVLKKIQMKRTLRSTVFDKEVKRCTVSCLTEQPLEAGLGARIWCQSGRYLPDRITLQVTHFSYETQNHACPYDKSAQNSISHWKAILTRISVPRTTAVRGPRRARTRSSQRACWKCDLDGIAVLYVGLGSQLLSPIPTPVLWHCTGLLSPLV